MSNILDQNAFIARTHWCHGTGVCVVFHLMEVGRYVDICNTDRSIYYSQEELSVNWYVILFLISTHFISLLNCELWFVSYYWNCISCLLTAPTVITGICVHDRISHNQPSPSNHPRKESSWFTLSSPSPSSSFWRIGGEEVMLLVFGCTCNGPRPRQPPRPIPTPRSPCVCLLLFVTTPTFRMPLGPFTSHIILPLLLVWWSFALFKPDNR